MSAQSIYSECPKRIFLLAHGAVIENKELHLEIPNLSINFYTPEGQYLEKMLIPGIFQFLNSPNNLNLLIKSQPNSEIYDDIKLPLTDANKEHVLFLQREDDMRLFPKCTNEVEIKDPSGEKIPVWNYGENSQYSIDKFLGTKDISKNLNCSIGDINVEVYRITKSELAGDWILKLKRGEKKALFLSNIVNTWLLREFKDKYPEIHWIACREYIQMDNLQKELEAK